MNDENMITLRNKKTGELVKVPRSQFVDSQPEEKQGLSGIASDIGQSAANFIPAMGEILTSLPGQAASAGKNIVQHPLRSALNAAAGVGEGAIAMGNLPGNVMDYLAKKGIVSQESADKTLHIPDLGIEKKLGIDQGDKGDNFIKMISSLLVPGKVAKLAGGGKLAHAGAFAGQAAGENNDPIHGALMATLVPYLGKKGMSVVSNMEMAPGGGIRKDWTKRYSSPLSDEQLLSNSQAAEGTNTGLGRVIGNPELMKYLETESRKYPESGSEKIMGETGNQIKDVGQKIIKDLQGDVPVEHYGDEVLNALKKAKKDVGAEKTEKYKSVNDLAEKNGVTTPRSNFIETAKKELNSAENDPHLSLFQNAGEMKKLKDIVENSDGKDFSLKDTDYLIGQIGDEMQSHFDKGNTSEYNLYKKLRDGLVKDRESAIERSSSPEELKKAHNEAKEFYKNEYAAFEDPDIAKWLRKGGDPDLLVRHFIRTGKFSDRSKLINKVQSKLPEDKQHILGSAYLSGAIKDGEFNPHQLRQLYKGLGEKQRKVLFPKGINSRLSNYSNLVDMNPEPLSLMLNPKTGFRDSSGPKVTDVLAPALMAGIGGHFGGMGTALAAGVLPYLAGKIKPRLIVKPKVERITSPEFRNEFIKRLIEQRAKNGD